MTYYKHFVAIRHESDLFTPLIESPMINFSVRELAYIGMFGLAAVFGAVGSLPLLFAALTFPLFILAFFRWHGEIPEMYLYFFVMSFLDPTAKKKRKKEKKTGHKSSGIFGFGGGYGLAETAKNTDENKLQDTIQKVSYSDEMVPIDITLDIGEARKQETVSVFIDDNKVVCDSTNSMGQIAISIMPVKGKKKFAIKDDSNATIITKMVEFVNE